jgi:hypothetical protein
MAMVAGVGANEGIDRGPVKVKSGKDLADVMFKSYSPRTDPACRGFRL